VTNPDIPDVTTSPYSEAEALKAVVRRNTELVQGQGDFALFDELFADDFVDHTPQPGTTPDKAGVRVLYSRLREAFPDFRPEIHWQTVDDDIVTTYKTYHGTQLGDFLGVAPTGKAIHFETVDAMRVRNGKITDHWGVANLYSVLQQLGQLPPTKPEHWVRIGCRRSSRGVHHGANWPGAAAMFRRQIRARWCRR
jgi:steroid delta-isomerase-like uncharacterized protein